MDYIWQTFQTVQSLKYSPIFSASLDSSSKLLLLLPFLLEWEAHHKIANLSKKPSGQGAGRFHGLEGWRLWIRSIKLLIFKV
jgi:hypothetical protein